MLVLSRLVGEEIVLTVGDEVVSVFVNDVRDQKVRLAIDASPKVGIFRREIYDRIQLEQKKPEDVNP